MCIRDRFGTVPLDFMEWVECLGLSMVVLIASELRKCVLRFIAKRKAASSVAISA